jgi:hypothetical protein
MFSFLGTFQNKFVPCYLITVLLVPNICSIEFSMYKNALCILNIRFIIWKRSFHSFINLVFDFFFFVCYFILVYFGCCLLLYLFIVSCGCVKTDYFRFYSAFVPLRSSFFSLSTLLSSIL